MVPVDRAKLLMKQKLERMIDATITKFEVRVRSRTPVDTGFARSRWQRTNTGRTRPPSLERGEHAPAVHNKGVTLGQTITVFDDAAYIEKLEYGHSQQAPHGMLRVTVAELPQLAKQAEQEENRG
jgi:hypothetical protein